MVWYFISVFIINGTLHGRLEIQNFSSRVEIKTRALTHEIFSTLKEKFRISAQPWNILYFFFPILPLTCNCGYFLIMKVLKTTRVKKQNQWRILTQSPAHCSREKVFISSLVNYQKNFHRSFFNRARHYLVSIWLSILLKFKMGNRTILMPVWSKKQQ